MRWNAWKVIYLCSEKSLRRLGDWMRWATKSNKRVRRRRRKRNIWDERQAQKTHTHFIEKRGPEWTERAGKTTTQEEVLFAGFLFQSVWKLGNGRPEIWSFDLRNLGKEIYELLREISAERRETIKMRAVVCFIWQFRIAVNEAKNNLKWRRWSRCYFFRVNSLESRKICRKRQFFLLLNYKSFRDVCQNLSQVPIIIRLFFPSFQSLKVV